MRVLLFTVLVGGCSTSEAIVMRQAKIDFPGCVVAEDGRWLGEAQVKVDCPGKDGLFICTYDVYPTYAMRKR